MSSNTWADARCEIYAFAWNSRTFIRLAAGSQSSSFIAPADCVNVYVDPFSHPENADCLCTTARRTSGRKHGGSWFS